MSRRAQALDLLAPLNRQITQVTAAVVSGSTSIAAQRLPVVAGVFGGFCGLSISYVLAAFMPELSFTALGPLFTVLGIAAGVLVFRRSTTMADETTAARRQIAIEDNEQIAKAILLRIQGLPRSAPPALRAELWQDYRVVTRELAQLARPRSQTGPSPPGDPPARQDPPGPVGQP